MRWRIGKIIAWVPATSGTLQGPRLVSFGASPKTSTGKIQKFDLRERPRQA
jgi:fatty-acyl-CoA synthase